MQRKVSKIKKVATGVGAVFALTFVSLSIAAFCVTSKMESLADEIEKSPEYKTYSTFIKQNDGVYGYIKSKYVPQHQLADCKKVAKLETAVNACLVAIPLTLIGAIEAGGAYYMANKIYEKSKQKQR